MEIKEINKENMMVTMVFTEEEYENHFATCGECGELMLISEAVIRASDQVGQRTRGGKFVSGVSV